MTTEPNNSAEQEPTKLAETPTPRTDAIATYLIDGEWYVSTPQVPADFACTLERELTQLRAERDALAEYYAAVHSGPVNYCAGNIDRVTAAEKAVGAHLNPKKTP